MSARRVSLALERDRSPRVFRFPLHKRRLVCAVCVCVKCVVAVVWDLLRHLCVTRPQPGKAIQGDRRIGLGKIPAASTVGIG